MEIKLGNRLCFSLREETPIDCDYFLEKHPIKRVSLFKFNPQIEQLRLIRKKLSRMRVTNRK